MSSAPCARAARRPSAGRSRPRLRSPAMDLNGRDVGAQALDRGADTGGVVFPAPLIVADAASLAALAALRPSAMDVRAARAPRPLDVGPRGRLTLRAGLPAARKVSLSALVRALGLAAKQSAKSFAPEPAQAHSLEVQGLRANQHRLGDHVGAAQVAAPPVTGTPRSGRHQRGRAPPPARVGRA